MKTLILLTIFFLNFLFLSASLNAQVKFETNYEWMQARGFLVCSDGGVLVYSGLSGSYSGPFLKTDSNGHMEWCYKLFNPIEGSYGTRTYGFARASDDGFIVGGTFDNYFSTRAFILKLNSQGITEWAKIDSSKSLLTALLQLNNSYLAIYSSTVNVDTFDITVQKFTEQGDAIWQKKIHIALVPPFNCWGALDYKVLSNNRWAILFKQGVAVFDSSGNSIAAYQYSNTVNMQGLGAGNNNSLLLCGYKCGYTYSPVACKIDSSGSLVFSKRYLPGAVVDVFEQMTDGGYLLDINSDQTSTIIKTDSLGNVVWSKKDYFPNASYGRVYLRNTGNSKIYLMADMHTNISYDNAYLLATDEHFSLPTCYLNDTINSTNYSLTISNLAITVDSLSTDFLYSVNDIQSVSYQPTEVSECFAVSATQPQPLSLNCMVTPNPFHQHLTLKISSPSNKKVTVSLLDVTGRILFENDSVDPNINFEINEELSGNIYFIHISQGFEHAVSKVIRQ